MFISPIPSSCFEPWVEAFQRMLVGEEPEELPEPVAPNIGSAEDGETSPIVKGDASLPAAGASPLSFFGGSDATAVLVDEEASTLERYSPIIEISPSAAPVVRPLAPSRYILLYPLPVPLAFEAGVVHLEKSVDIRVSKDLVAHRIHMRVGRDVIVRGKSLTALEIHLIAGRDVCLTDVTLKANQITIWAPCAIKVNGLVRCICRNLNTKTIGCPPVQMVDRGMWDARG